VNKGAEVNAKYEYGCRALHYAAKYGYNDIVKMLIARGAQINAKDDFGQTPLDLALKSGHRETSALLRKYGGRTNVAIVYAAARSFSETKSLLDSGADVNAAHGISGRTALHVAVMFSRKDIAALLIARGANVNVKDNTGQVPLHYVAYCKEGKEISELLVRTAPR